MMMNTLWKADIANSYIPLNVEGTKLKRQLEKKGYANKQKENLWKRYKTVVSENFKSPVVAISLNPATLGSTNEVFISGSTRVDNFFLTSSVSEKGKIRITTTKNKSYTRFKNYVRCTICRSDGRLVAAGDDTGTVHIFETQNYTQLRRLKGHTGSVRCCYFSADRLSYLLTGGDDAVLRLWDISDGSCMVSIPHAHGDIIRCVSSAPSFSSETFLFASGSYDTFVKIWTFDIESTSAKKEIFQSNSLGKNEDSSPFKMVTAFHHNHAVESLVFFRKNSMIITAGGPEIKIWDICGGGVLIHCIQSHMKTVTSVDVALDESYIVSGSLDQTVKFHCPSSFTLLHSITYNEPVTCVAVSFHNNTGDWLAVGFSEGQWSVRRRLPLEKLNKKKKNDPASLVSTPRPDTTQFFQRGIEAQHEKDDIVIDTVISKKSCWLDRLIQGFYHQKSLADVIKKGPPDAAIALIETLIEQNVLHIAVRGKDEDSILSLFNFVHQELGSDENTTSLLHEFTHTLLAENPWLYATTDKAVIQSLERISNKLDLDVSQHQTLRELVGILDIVETYFDF